MNGLMDGFCIMTKLWNKKTKTQKMTYSFCSNWKIKHKLNCQVFFLLQIYTFKIT